MASGKVFFVQNAASYVFHDLHVKVDSNFQTDTIFLDFAKAFAKVPISVHLLMKLAALHPNADILAWIE